jgi:hypothetical protein
MLNYGEALANCLRMSLSEEIRRQESASPSSTSTSNVPTEGDSEAARTSSGRSVERTASGSPEEFRATGTSPAHATHEGHSRGMPNIYLRYFGV